MNDNQAARINMLKEYLREDPRDSFSAYALALEYERLGELNKAIGLLEQLLITDPDYLPAYYQLGKCYEQMKNNVKAAEHYANGITLARKLKDTKTLNELQSALDLTL